MTLRALRLKRLRCLLWGLSLSRRPNFRALAEGNLSWYLGSGFQECHRFHPRLVRPCKGQCTTITESIRHALAHMLLQHNQLFAHLCWFTCNWPFPQKLQSRRPASLGQVRHQLYLSRVTKIYCLWNHQGWCCRWESKSGCSEKCSKSCLMHWRHHSFEKHVRLSWCVIPQQLAAFCLCLRARYYSHQNDLISGSVLHPVHHRFYFRSSLAPLLFIYLNAKAS